MDTKQPENPPAFPSGKSEKTGFENSHPLHEGMTLRDYFAAKAMQGMVSPEYADGVACSREHVAESAYAIADAMLSARAGTGKGVQGE